MNNDKPTFELQGAPGWANWVTVTRLGSPASESPRRLA